MDLKKLFKYGLITILILLIGVAWLNRRDQMVGFGQEIQYDDFAFAVLDVTKRDELGTGTSRRQPDGIYYVVKLRVTNHAKRVPFVFDPKIAVVVDDSGRDHHVSPPGQVALQSEPDATEPCSTSLPAGDSCTHDLVFELPDDTRDAHFRVSWGGRFVDVVDLIFCGDKRITLEPKSSLSDDRTPNG